MFLWLLLFLAPPLPIAAYLLVLGALNRGRHPVLVPGSWDFAGVLFAASGFLLCGGPIVLSLLNERWRESWLFSPPETHAPGSPGSWFWLFLFVLYYVLVVLAAVFLIRRQRRLTAVYNTLPQTVELVLSQVFDRFGLTPVRSGPLYLFGTSAAALRQTKGNRSDLIHPPPYPPPPGSEQAGINLLELSSKGTGPTAVLELEPFPAMQHVTLRWDPADSLLRKEVEGELARRLTEYPTPRHDLGVWLTILGISVLGITLTGGCSGVLVLLLTR